LSTVQIVMARRELQRARCDHDTGATERRMNAVLDQFTAAREPVAANAAR